MRKRFFGKSKDALLGCITAGAVARGVHPGRAGNTGRTLLEMLAVLAIVGILSVAALAGLTWAMAKYRANDTMHDVAVWTFAALDSNHLYDMSSGQLILPELGSVSTHGYPMAVWIQDKDVFTIHVNDVPKRVCSLMLDMIDENQTLTVNDVRFNNDDICTNDTNTLVFYMNKDRSDVGSICIPSCDDGETCCGGECRTITTPCGADGCTDCGSQFCTNSNTCCDNPNAVKCGNNDCCEGNCCNNVCCPSDQVCGSDGNCACQNNLVMNPTTGLCECPADAPYYFEEANLCCKSGYTPVDGVCMQIYCDAETNAKCYINGKTCGWYCSDLGRHCKQGTCYADQCPAEMPFERLPGNWLGDWYYGCRLPGTDCFKITPTHDFLRCFRDADPSRYWCCEADTNGTCYSGTCDPQVCDAFEGTTYQHNEGLTMKNGGCFWSDTGVTCYPINEQATLWKCYDPVGRLCSSNCSDPPSCNTACETVTCPNGETYDPEKKLCCQTYTDGVNSSQTVEICCDFTVGFPICYRNGNMCGYGCETNASRCTYGECFVPTCPDGMSYQPLFFFNGDAYGCVDETNTKACYFDLADNARTCTYNGNDCGRQCHKTGEDFCEIAFMKECAQSGHCPQTGYAMTDGCTCDGDVTSVNGTDYCCPTGHTYINGGCVII